MTEAKQKLALARKRPAAKKAKTGAGRKKAGKKAEENSNDPGEVVLNSAAKEALTTGGGSIAAMLLRESLFGISNSTKLLVDLADEPAAEATPEAQEPFVSQALKLANEPRWRDEDPDALAETSHVADAEND
jgi:hypothetical protein